MPMFRGRINRNIDGKGRLMLPPEFRESLQDGDSEGRFVMTNFDECVVGYPMDEWREIESGFNNIKNAKRTVRDFMRLFLGSAVVVQMDKQGRVLIPPSLREYGGLEKEVALVGVGSKFELWDKDRFDRIMEQDFDDVSDAIAETGIEVKF